MNILLLVVCAFFPTYFFPDHEKFSGIKHKIFHHKIIFTFVLLCIFAGGVRQVTFDNCHKVIQMAERVQCHVNSGRKICRHSYLMKYYTI